MRSNSRPRHLCRHVFQHLLNHLLNHLFKHRLEALRKHPCRHLCKHPFKHLDSRDLLVGIPHICYLFQRVAGGFLTRCQLRCKLRCKCRCQLRCKLLCKLRCQLRCQRQQPANLCEDHDYKEAPSHIRLSALILRLLLRSNSQPSQQPAASHDLLSLDYF